MENELMIFKKKIAYRFDNREIPNTYEFPRYQTHLVKIKTPLSSRSISRNTKGYSSREASQERENNFMIREVVDLNLPLNRQAEIIA